MADNGSKDFGKILFISGIHHEKDREVIYRDYKSHDIKLVEWESKNPCSLKDGFVFTNSEHLLSAKEKQVYKGLLEKWAGEQDVNQLFSRLVSITQNGVVLSADKYTLDLSAKTFSTDESSLVIDFSDISGFTFTTGDGCTFKTGSNCTFTTHSNCTFTTYDNCTFTTYGYCTFTTKKNCVCVRRDVFEFFEIPPNKKIMLNGYGIKGFK